MSDDFGAFNPFEEVENSTEDISEIDKISNAEKKQTEIEKTDKKNIELTGENYKDLDDDILDVDEEDTMWMIQRVSIGILKIAGILIFIIFIFWSIWGKERTSKEREFAKEKTTKQKVVKKQNPAKKTELNKIIPKINNPGFFEKLLKKNSKDDERLIPAVSIEDIKKGKPSVIINNKTLSPHTASVQIMAWNYWLEKNRLRVQKDTPGEVMIWKKNSTALFDIPFIEQVSGKNDTERKKKVFMLISTIESLLKRAEVLQTKLLLEINEFSAKTNMYQQEALQYENKFLNAMNQADPSGIDLFLKGKIEAEKKQTENGVETESRKILSEKIDSYAQVLINLREYLIANQRALIKDVQIVKFPEDPFHRIISISEWENLKLPQN
jgi:hypothetical protein